MKNGDWQPRDGTDLLFPIPYGNGTPHWGDCGGMSPGNPPPIRRGIGAAAVAAAAALTSCATPANLAQQDDLSICRSFGIYRIGVLAAEAPKYRAEMERRNLLTAAEWQSVREGRVHMGMSQCGMYAARGAPDRENRTVYSGGVRIQHVFNAGYRYIRATYIYTHNGKVVSWQD